MATDERTTVPFWQHVSEDGLISTIKIRLLRSDMPDVYFVPPLLSIWFTGGWEGLRLK